MTIPRYQRTPAELDPVELYNLLEVGKIYHRYIINHYYSLVRIIEKETKDTISFEEFCVRDSSYRVQYVHINQLIIFELWVVTEDSLWLESVLEGRLAVTFND